MVVAFRETERSALIVWLLERVRRYVSLTRIIITIAPHYQLLNESYSNLSTRRHRVLLQVGASA